MWLVVVTLSAFATPRQDEDTFKTTLSPPKASPTTSSIEAKTPLATEKDSTLKRSLPPPPPALSPLVSLLSPSSVKGMHEEIWTKGNLRASASRPGLKPGRLGGDSNLSSPWLRASANCEGGIIAMTYATFGGKDDRFCRSVESALQHGVSLRVLGWGKDWRGLTQKLEGSLDALKNLPDQCTVVFTDAYDVLYADDLKTIKSKFDNLGESVIFAGECGCWPQITRDKGKGHVCLHDYPKSPTPYKYLNSGQWIAKKTAALEIFTALIEEAHVYAERYNVPVSKINDQEMVSDMYMDGR